MIQLSEDPNFQYEIIRSLGLVRYCGGDIGEQLAILPKIRPGNFEDWHREWRDLALRVLSTIDEKNLSRYSAATLRDVYFRASHYFFEADFFLHGNPEDPRLNENFNLWREYYDKANAQLTVPGKHALIPTKHGFDIPIIIYRAAEASASNPRPTLIVGGGFDSNYEESMHTFGFATLERGYNVVLYEGPGQPSLLQKQQVGFIHDWEKVVTPIVDYLIAQNSSELPFIDTSKIGLAGLSLGGLLAARAAAFELRLAAVMCIDGVWSFSDTCMKMFPDLRGPWEQGDKQAFDSLFESLPSNTGTRWARDHLKYSFQSKSGYECFKTVSKMTLDGIADKIKMPAFIGEATGDLFFDDQPLQVVRGIGSNATLFKFDEGQAAQQHCQSGALVYLNQQMMEWFAGVVGERKK